MFHNTLLILLLNYTNFHRIPQPRPPHAHCTVHSLCVVTVKCNLYANFLPLVLRIELNSKLNSNENLHFQQTELQTNAEQDVEKLPGVSHRRQQQ